MAISEEGISEEGISEEAMSEEASTSGTSEGTGEGELHPRRRRRADAAREGRSTARGYTRRCNGGDRP